MAAKKLYSPSISIGGTEFKCLARSVGLSPGAHINFCEQEWTFTAAIELGYGATGSWTVLEGFQDTVQTVILKPEDEAAGADNPSATFEIRVPAVDFMSPAARGERMIFNLSVTTEAAPVFATA